MYDKKKFVIAFLKKAEIAFNDAKTLSKTKSWNGASNRLYYACFYAISAYLECKNIKVNTHSGVKSKLHQELIKTKIINRDLGKLFDKLFDLRLEADYDTLILLEENDVEPLFDGAENFINKIEKIIATNRDCVDG